MESFDVRMRSKRLHLMERFSALSLRVN